MSTFLTIATRNAARGFKVHPLKVKDKAPLLTGWPDKATNDREQIEQWSQEFPEANCGVAIDERLCVLESDNLPELEKRLGAPVPHTFTVQARQGRPHFYFWQTDKTRTLGNKTVAGTFEFKQYHCYVVSEGSIHPSGPEYKVIDPVPVVDFPDWLADKLRELHGESKTPSALPERPLGIGEGRHARITSIAGKLRTTGMDVDEMEAALQARNEVLCDPMLSQGDIRHIAESICRYPVPEPEPELLPLSGPVQTAKTVSDWREHFHTLEETDNSPGITFLIDGFLQCEGVTGIAAPVRERKSLIALNVALALVTGEKLFGHFEVVRKPERVLYLCPEVSLGPFADRVKKIGLRDYVGKTFFYRTLSAEGHLKLNDEALQKALPGAVIVLDTAIRFLQGDENSSTDVRAFADGIFSLLRNGALAVVLLHHSPKGSGDVMTLENAMRGSGDLGAFLACCWGTRLQDPADPYKSASFLSNLKMRDFESKDFEVTCGPDCRLHIVGDPALQVPTLAGRKNRANRDGMEDAAVKLLRASPTLSLRATSRALKDAGIQRGRDWVREKRYELLQENGGQLPAGCPVSGDVPDDSTVRP